MAWLAMLSIVPANAQAPAIQMRAPAVAVEEPVGPLPGPGAERSLPHANPYRNDPVAGQGGRRIFVSFNCSGCHGAHGGGGMGPSLRDEAWIYGGGSADIFDSIAEGRAHGMPAWGSLLPPRYIWQLVTYIETLRTPREVDPPEPT
jgi:cytochrome c oxidase cbb3-type subunit 3